MAVSSHAFLAFAEKKLEILIGLPRNTIKLGQNFTLCKKGLILQIAQHFQQEK